MEHQVTSAKIDASYALIALGSTTLWSVTNGWLLYFYLPPGGNALVPLATFGPAMLMVNALHAISEPPIGYLSDHTCSRWGRRLPFMFCSTVPMLTLFVLLWTPPMRSESAWNLFYLATVLLIYKIMSSLHQIPFQALLPELALTDRHRVRILAWSASFQLVGMILGSLAGPFIETFNFDVTALIYASVTFSPSALLSTSPNGNCARFCTIISTLAVEPTQIRSQATGCG